MSLEFTRDERKLSVHLEGTLKIVFRKKEIVAGRRLTLRVRQCENCAQKFNCYRYGDEKMT